MTGLTQVEDFASRTETRTARMGRIELAPYAAIMDTTAYGIQLIRKPQHMANVIWISQTYIDSIILRKGKREQWLAWGKEKKAEPF